MTLNEDTLEVKARFLAWRASREQPARGTKPRNSPPSRLGAKGPRVPEHERLSKIRDLALAGATFSQIVTRGFPAVLVERAERTFGIVIERRRVGKGRTHDFAKIRELYAELKDCAEVGRRLGVDRRTVYRIAVQSKVST